ncbi:FliM/FliN family flagellar motor switch protein [Gynuella sp.]|uniref:FliM/FliN family flagellar motor switch protein n=1 Tax=Gynuella sp. TaxID=2969146 RepID=UPI003D10EFB5
MNDVELQEVEPSKGTGHPILDKNMDYLKDIEVELQVRVGKARLSVEELFSMAEDSVIPLLESVDDPVELLLKDKVVARGMLTVVGNQFGVKVTEIAS